jgi:hypothetical protein
MSDKHQYKEVVSTGGIALNFRILPQGEVVPHELRGEDGIAERAAAISYMCPELNTDEAKALAQIEPRLSFHPRAIQSHVLAHIDTISGTPVTAKGPG